MLSIRVRVTLNRVLREDILAYGGENDKLEKQHRFVLFTEYYWGDQIKANQLGRTYVTCTGDMGTSISKPEHMQT